MASYPSLYRAQAVAVNGSSMTAFVPQVFGETAVTVKSFIGGGPPSRKEMGWIFFQGGSPSYPVWLSEIFDGVGSQGPAGPPGAQGPAGQSVQIKGSVASSTNLTGIANPVVGDGYITTNTGHLWVFGGPLPNDNITKWADVGNVTGPPGATGPAGPAGVVQAVVAGTNVTVNSTDPTRPVVNTVPSPTPSWISAPLNSGWVNRAGNQAVSYRKVGDMVYVRGVIDWTASANNPMFTLPVGYRPPAGIGFITAVCSSTTDHPQYTVSLFIYADGTINGMGLTATLGYFGVVIAFSTTP